MGAYHKDTIDIPLKTLRPSSGHSRRAGGRLFELRMEVQRRANDHQRRAEQYSSTYRPTSVEFRRLAASLDTTQQSAHLEQARFSCMDFANTSKTVSEERKLRGPQAGQRIGVVRRRDGAAQQRVVCVFHPP